MSAAVTWLQSSIGVDVTGEWARHLHLNVGGVLYTTRRQTFRALREHRIFGPLLAGRGHRCEDGSFLIDRDGALFRYVLDYLRNGTLAVPENFSEWDMLLQEVRYYQLPELERLILDRFDYQRCLFRRQLPHGVYVLWPPLAGAAAVTLDPRPSSAAGGAGGTGHATSSGSGDGDNGGGSSNRSHGETPLAAAPSAPVGGLAGSAEAVGASVCHSSKPQDAAPSSSPSSSPPRPPLHPQAQSSSATSGSTATMARVRIVPPLPGLEVEAEQGSTVVFRSTQVLYDLDQLVTVLISAYGYSIQHWDERRGRVLLTLPGAL